MDQKEILNYFNDILEGEPNVSAGIAAIRTLMEVVRRSTDCTVFGLNRELDMGLKVMKERVQVLPPGVAISSACKLFMRYITLKIYHIDDFSECRRIMLEHGQNFLDKYVDVRAKIAKLAFQFIINGSKILTHSRSRVVLQVLKEAAERGKNFKVFVTASAPNNTGEDMCRDLQKLGIECTVILDCAMGSIMETIDTVLVGSEGVMESGGIINKIGTHAIALCAHAYNREVYVVAESFKFTQFFPLNQKDLPDDFKDEPLVDYTPPNLIRLIISDLGVLPPPAVCGKLFELYL